VRDRGLIICDLLASILKIRLDAPMIIYLASKARLKLVYSGITLDNIDG
jgi:hypothetical protein